MISYYTYYCIIIIMYNSRSLCTLFPVAVSAGASGISDSIQKYNNADRCCPGRPSTRRRQRPHPISTYIVYILHICIYILCTFSYYLLYTQTHAHTLQRNATSVFLQESGSRYWRRVLCTTLYSSVIFFMFERSRRVRVRDK